LPEDLKFYRAIQRSGRAAEAYAPWVRKMGPSDRLAIESKYKPDLPPLEWKRAGDVWLGRLPRKEGNGARR
jgi:hypothetical protein